MPRAPESSLLSDDSTTQRGRRSEGALPVRNFGHRVVVHLRAEEVHIAGSTASKSNQMWGSCAQSRALKEREARCNLPACDCGPGPKMLSVRGFKPVMRKCVYWAHHSKRLSQASGGCSKHFEGSDCVIRVCET